MASVAMIGKLVAGAVQVDSVRGTATDGLSKAELAGMLSGLSEHEMNLALAKYGCDANARAKLLFHVSAYATTLGMAQGWKPRSRELFCGMAVLAVAECIDKAKLSGRAKAELIGVCETKWRERWRDRYEQVWRYVNEMDNRIVHTLRKS